MVADKAGAEMVLIHVSEPGDDTVSLGVQLENLKQWAPENVPVTYHIGGGDFFSVIPTIVTDLEVDMVVVPTHGKVGILQNLFGANILKLVKSLPVPALVVQEGVQASHASFKTLLFPVGPHADFDIKIKQTAQFASIFDSTVIIYTVRNDVRGLSEELRRNISASKSYFKEHAIKFEEVSEEPTGYSVGYAKHILHYAKTNQVGAICIMSKVSDANEYIGNTDKENTLLNDAAIPVYCTNS
jgi:hypothetical protein